MADDRGTTSQLLPSHVTHLMLVGVMAAALVGFLVGIDVRAPDDVSELMLPTTTHDSQSHALAAQSYADMRITKASPNENWRSDFEQIPRADTSSIKEIKPDADARARALAARADRRAFDGAPPVIPHSVDSGSSANCISCHAESVRLGNATAKLMPHAYMASCLQCHAPANGSLFDPMPVAPNSFVGRPAPGPGSRAWNGAPPIIPHTTQLRTNCLSCHGPTGQAGLRTPHPAQTSCLQCHSPSAALDQRPGTTSSKLIGLIESLTSAADG